MALSLDDIQNFIMTAKLENVTHAAKKLGLSQPALSYSLKRVEREIGGELFIRLQNGVKLTKLGERFQIQGRKVIGEWEKAQELLSDEYEGNYKIGFHPSVALYSVEHFLPKLSKDFPKISIDLVYGRSQEIFDKVLNWEIDFGLIINPKKRPDLVVKEICKDEVGIFSRKANAKTLITDPELLQSQWIQRRLKSQYEKHMTCENFEVLAKLVSLGVGDGILPARVAANYPRLKMTTKSPIFYDHLCLVYLKERQKSLAGKAVIQTILDANI